MCAAIPFVLNVWFVDIPAGATQEEGHSGFLHLHLTGLTVVLIQQGCSCFLARRSSSRILCMNELFIPHLSDYVLSKQRSGVQLGTAPELSWYQLSPPNVSRAGPTLKYLNALLCCIGFLFYFHRWPVWVLQIRASISLFMTLFRQLLVFYHVVSMGTTFTIVGVNPKQRCSTFT